MSDDPAPMIGTKLADRYELLAELGRGGMGVVYRAKDPVLNREVAIKLIPPGNLTANAEERFLREAQIVAQMDHPAIVPIHDLGRHEGSLFFVMPVLPGTNLRQLVREGSLRLGDVLDIGTQVAEALDYSHARGIVHRDIKPENIMTSRDESGHVRARVMDFGLALAASEDRLTKTGTLVGTVSYFSPEQVTSRTFDGRTDLYALGAVLYECLSGEAPFTGEVQTILYRVVHEVPQSLQSLGAGVSEELDAIVLSCLEKDPERRPKRGAHLAESLRRYRAKLHEEEYTRSVILTASRMISRPAAAASPFVGREKELTALQKRLHAALSGECQLAVVSGEPGTGKSRLIEELVALARARKIRVLSGRFVEQDRAFAHQGFCELIQDWFRSRESGSSAVSQPDLSDLAADLVALFPVLGEIGELRAAAASGVGAAEAVRKTEDKTAIFELIARTLTRLAQGKPLVLVLENLHGAELSIEALQYLVRRLGPTPTLVVGTYRQTEVGPKHPLLAMLDAFADDPRFLAIALGPLSASEVRALVESVAGGGRLADDLAERLCQATEGNPFFAKELVRSLLDSGGIARDASGLLAFSGGAEISSDALPATIQQAIERRIKRLPDDLRDVLSVASVLGRSLEFKDLETLAEGTRDLEDAVDRLIAEGCLEEERESRGDRLAFNSGIMRDVLYNAFSRRKRRSLHRKYADVLEKRYAGRLERVYPELLHHFTQGDVPEKSVEYGLKLAEKALSSSSPDEALRVARATLDILEEQESALSREGEARLLLARAHRMAGNVDAALDETESAIKVFEEVGDGAGALGATVFAAETAWQGRRVDETRRFAERGIEAARSLSAVDHQRALLSLAATVASLRGEYVRSAEYLAEIERLSAGQRKPAAEEIPSGGRLVVAMASQISAREPASTQIDEETEILANVFETLVATDQRGNPIPALCEEWRVLDGGTTVRLKLRKGVRFSDGTPLTAEAVRASFTHTLQVRKEEIPAALATVQGVEDFLEGRAGEVSGLVVAGEDLDIRLTTALPIFPALLTDRTAAVAIPSGEGVVGTGPYRISRFDGSGVLLERNAFFRDRAPRLDAIEFRVPVNPNEIARGLRAGDLDIGRDLFPEDLEAILREPRLRPGLAEAPKKNTYFITFNTNRPLGASEPLRRALGGVVRTQDLVWSALGRFALPAIGLLPPGILGHDSGRRRPHLTRERAAELILSSGLPAPLTLRAALHPFFRDRYRALTTSLFALWEDVGVSVAVDTPTMAEYLESYQKPQDYDIRLGRWNADYDDPDNFTFSLFESRNGVLKGYFSSPETDALLEEARREGRPVVREGLYRKFETLLLDRGIVIPLFHDVDYRIASPSVRGLALRSDAPYVNYAELGKVEAPAPHASTSLRLAGEVLRVPMGGLVESLDPAVADTVEPVEVIPSIFETLTRDEGGRVVPWLASDFRAEKGGTQFRFFLRPGVRFHDGRALTARDVRSSFERLLMSRDSQSRWLLSSIRGAKALLDGLASDLAGIQIVSPLEIVIELEEPISFFPVLMSTSSAAILPEGTGALGATWRTGCVGTGPFRVVDFEPGRRLELERNPEYWRQGYPRSEGIEFRFGVPPEEIRRDFEAGRLSLASDLLPADADALRHDPRFASTYRESPRLLTYVLAFNSNGGVFQDVRLRRGIAEGLDVPALVTKTLGRRAFHADGLIPPGLLGHAAAPRGRGAAGSSTPDQTISQETVEVTARVHPIFFGEYAGFADELIRVLREMGFRLRPLNRTMAEYMSLRRHVEADLHLGRWDADYPDADSFARGVLHSREGFLGRSCGSPEIDRIVERGRAESDPRVRHSLYRQMEEIVRRDSILVPLFHEQVYRFARPELEGLTVSFGAPAVAYENLRVRAKR